MFREFCKEVFLGKEECLNRRVIVLHVVLMTLSFLFIYLYSYTTSFRYPFVGGDSAVFQCVAKFWLDGYIPYKDIFDHKGPIIYLVDAIGYALQPRSGIMVPQIIALYITLVFMWRMLSFRWRGASRIIFSVLSVIFLAWFYSNNMTEEFSLPFIAASAYCFMTWLITSTLTPLHGLIYGMGFGACVLLRTTNSLPICCFVFLTALELIRARDFKALRQNALSFIAGFAMIVLPFVAYFAANDALYDALYGTILFNIHYATEGSFHHEASTYIILNAINLMPLILTIIASLIELSFDRKNTLAWICLFVSTMLLMMFLKIRSYKHYVTIIVPILPLMFMILSDALNDSFRRLKEMWHAPGFSFKRMIICKTLLPLLILPLMLYVGFCFKTYLEALTFPFSEKLTEEESDFLRVRAEIDEMQKLIPHAERNSVVTWGHSGSVARWILETGIKPRDRFFYNQTALSPMDPTIRNGCLARIKQDYPLWILYGYELDKEALFIFVSLKDEELERLLEDKYVYKGEVSIGVQTLKLYRLHDQ